MLYKFDVLFSKRLTDGGVKVVTYGQLLEDPEAFGTGEGLSGAVGELSMVLEGAEAGFSINSLIRKYRSRLVGRMNAELFGKDFPLRFVFGRPDDLSSVRMELRDEDGNVYTSETHTETVSGILTLDMSDINSFVILIAQEGRCELTDDSDVTVSLSQGQAVLCPESVKALLIQADKSTLLVARSVL